jgi:hypothetical protein
MIGLVDTSRSKKTVYDLRKAISILSHSKNDELENNGDLSWKITDSLLGYGMWESQFLLTNQGYKEF